MNRDPKSWNRILWSHKLMEIKVVVNGLRFGCAGQMLGFLEQQESPSGTLVTARHHIRDAGGALIHEKCCFSYFRRTGITRVGFVLLGTRFLIVRR